MKQQLIFISQAQFGYQSGTYYHCKYLKSVFAITCIVWDHALIKISMNEVRVIYVSRKGNMIVRSLRFVKTVLSEIKNQKRPLIYIQYFKFISLMLRLLLPKQKIVLDIRTGCISKYAIRRKLYDCLLRFEACFFKNVVVISEGLAKRLKMYESAHILPLGADVISDTTKTFDEINLLYVGTLFMRNIDETIKGFKKFYDQFNGQVRMMYTIVGSGLSDEVSYLRRLVDDYKLGDVIKIVGKIPHDQLKKYFDSYNVGVAYIPKTDYFDVQPATKVFEYLMSGMAVIATSTSENKKVINQYNGVLIDDNAGSFYDGLKILRQRQFKSDTIRKTCADFSWEKIVKENLKKYLMSLTS
jgi:glycosyltransferase involved in cell wall biosynthesis